MHVAAYLASTVEIPVEEVLPWHARSVLPGIRRVSRTVAIHPGSGSERKNWPIASYAELIQTLWTKNYEVLLLAGPAEEQKLAYLERHLEPPPDLYRTLVNAPLLEIAQQIEHCRGYVGNDSGITHLASMLGIRTMTIFGPATESRIWEPLGAFGAMIGVPDLELLRPYVIMMIINNSFRL